MKNIYWNSTIREKLEVTLATHMHDAWRRSVSGEQIRPDRDLDGNKLAGTKVNINVPFTELTKGWKKYNSTLAVKYIEGFRDSKFTSDVEILSDMIHTIWMWNNEWERDSKPYLFVSYKELPEHEKDKDRAIAEFIINVYTDSICTDINAYFEFLEEQGFDTSKERAKITITI